MLIVDVYGKTREINPDGWFRNVFDEELLMTDEFARRMIKEVAKCDIISPNLVISEILGAVSPEWIGSGCKSVLVMKYADPEDGVVNLKWCGDNMIPYIREVAESKDVMVNIGNMSYPIFSRDYGEWHGKVMIKNTGNIFTNGLDFLRELHRLQIDGYDEWAERYYER